MTQPAPNPHTQRSVAGMVGSMIVVVIAVVAWVGFRSAISDPPEPPPRVVDWTVSVNIGRQAGALAMYAPDALPVGWSAKDARYTGGTFPKWQLALRTNDVRTVSVTEALTSAESLVEDIDKDADQGEDITINGVRWQTWKFSKGDYGVSLVTQSPTGAPESVLVHGSASQDQTRDFASTLKPGSGTSQTSPGSTTSSVPN